MTGNPPRTMRPFASWFVSIYFAAVALYSLILAFWHDPYCLPLYVQAGLALASAIGVFMVKRWSLWLSAISLPPIIALELSALDSTARISGFNPNLSTVTMNVSYLIIVVVAVFSSLLLVDQRREFR